MVGAGTGSAGTGDGGWEKQAKRAHFGLLLLNGKRQGGKESFGFKRWTTLTKEELIGNKYLRWQIYCRAWKPTHASLARKNLKSKINTDILFYFMPWYQEGILTQQSLGLQMRNRTYTVPYDHREVQNGLTRASWYATTSPSSQYSNGRPSRMIICMWHDKYEYITRVNDKLSFQPNFRSQAHLKHFRTTRIQLIKYIALLMLTTMFDVRLLDMTIFCGRRMLPSSDTVIWLRVTIPWKASCAKLHWTHNEVHQTCIQDIMNQGLHAVAIVHNKAAMETL